MPKTIVIHGRCANPGYAVGEALVSTDGISGFTSVNVNTGIITERDHSISDQCITDKILIFPYAKGSSGWANTFQAMRFLKTGPKAMLINILNTKSALGVVACDVPSMTAFDKDPTKEIKTGDHVVVDATNGRIIVTRFDDNEDVDFDASMLV